MASGDHSNTFKIMLAYMAWKFGKKRCLESSIIMWNKSAIVSLEQRYDYIKDIISMKIFIIYFHIL